MNWHKLLETNPLVERLYELSSFHVCNLVWTRSLAICTLWVLGMTWYLSLSFWMDLFVVCHFDYINQKNYWPLDKQPGPFLLVEYTDDFPNRNHGTTLQLYTIINLDERTLSWSDSLPLVRGSSKHLYIHTINLIASCLLSWCISSLDMFLDKRLWKTQIRVEDVRFLKWFRVSIASYVTISLLIC